MNVRDHVLRGTSTTLRQSFSAGDADATVTVEVLRGDATQLVAPTIVSDVGVGEYQYVLAPLADVDRLTAIWRGAWGGVSQELRSELDVVGSHLFTIAQARAYDRSALADTTNYPDAAIREARAGIADFFQEVCDQAFIPRYGVQEFSGGAADAVRIADENLVKILRVSNSGASLGLSGITLGENGRVWRSAGWPAGYRNLRVEYEHGMTATPYRIHQAALMLARYELVNRDISDRTVSLSNELGAVRLSVPGRDYPTGIPFVDSTLSRYERRTLIGIA